MYRKIGLLAIIVMFIFSFSTSIAIVNAEDVSTPIPNEEIDHQNDSETDNTDGDNEESNDIDESEMPDSDNEADNNEDESNEESTNDTESDEEDPNETDENLDDDADTCDTSDQQITLILGEKTDVCAGQKVQLGTTENYVTMPDDLPEGTTLTVQNQHDAAHVQRAEQSQNLYLAGDVFEFQLDAPTNDFSQFKLKMQYGNGYINPDIHYFDESQDAWVAQDASPDYDDFTLNMNVDGFSAYGVFAKVESDEVVDEVDNNENDNAKDDTASNVCDDYEEEIIYNLHTDQTIEICADQKVSFVVDDPDNNDTIADRTVAYIHTPKDLPNGTTMDVNDISNDDDVKASEIEQNLYLCGFVLSFDVTLPDNTSFSDPFQLHMTFCNGGDNPDIYYYDENKGEWIAQSAKIQGVTPEEIEKGAFATLHTDVDHFSSYGVFDTLSEDNEPINEKKKESNDGDDVIRIDTDENDEDAITVVEEDDDMDEETTITVEDGDDEIKSSGGILPTTATDMFNYLLIGGGLLLAGLVVFLLRKKFAAK